MVLTPAIHLVPALPYISRPPNHVTPDTVEARHFLQKSFAGEERLETGVKLIRASDVLGDRSSGLVVRPLLWQTSTWEPGRGSIRHFHQHVDRQGDPTTVSQLSTRLGHLLANTQLEVGSACDMKQV